MIESALKNGNYFVPDEHINIANIFYGGIKLEMAKDKNLLAKQKAV